MLDPFEGEAFSYLSRFKCTIVGPRCLLSCLAESVPVPELPYPMYTAALRGCVVTSTGYDREEKAKMQLRVERMGGIYANAFHDGVTHLVAKVVKSQKYDVAIRKEVPIFTDEWLDKVWEVGKHENVHARDKRFLRYSCPALKGLVICVSQMPRKDKDALRKKIEAHGGVYSAVLDMEQTAILVTPTTNGDKYDYARKWQIPCLGPDWIFDSIDRGHCLPTQPYRVDAAKSSTPTKEGETSKVDEGRLGEVSMVSMIAKPGGKAPTDETMTRKVDESVASAAGNLSLIGVTAKSSGTTEELLRKLEQGRVKRAGLFLDECAVFLTGFSENNNKKIESVLHSAGAKQMKQIAPSLTHMVVGPEEAQKRREHFEAAKKLGATPYRVTLQWVVESMQLGRPASEEDCLFAEDEGSSPRSGGGKRRSSANATMLPPRSGGGVRRREEPEEPEEEYENNLLLQYKKSDAKKDDDRDETIQFKMPAQQEAPEQKKKEEEEESSQATMNTEDGESQVSRFLTDKKLALVGFGEDAESDLGEWVNEAGGEFVFRDFKGLLDYLVVPMDGAADVAVKSGFRAREVVTEYWLEDCLDAGSLLPVEYYHRQIKVDREARPCHGAVIGITNYVGKERQFVTALAEALGALAQEIFAKRDKRGAKQSTHLVCAKPEGAKYEAAIKWGLPVVTKDWMLACSRDMAWVSEKSFLVGEAVAYDKDRPEPSEERPEEKEDGVPLDVESEPEEVEVLGAEVEEGEEEKGEPEKVKTPRQSSSSKDNYVPDLETPGPVNMDELRPSRVRALRRSSVDPGWAGAESQPSPSQRTLKRKRQDEDENLPFFLEGAKTPDTPYGAFLGGGDPTPTTRKIWKRRCQELAKFEMSEEEKARVEGEADRARRAREEEKSKGERAQAEMEEAFKEHEKRFLDPEKVKANKKVAVPEDDEQFKAMMEAKLKKSGLSWKNPKRKSPDREGEDDDDEREGSSSKKARRTTPIYKNNIMKDVVVCVAKKLHTVQDEINGIVASLGGEFRYQYGPEVTHFVFSSARANDVTKDFRQARKDGAKVVCPDWVYMSRDEGRLVEEEAFPHTFNPRMTLSVSVSGGGGSSPNTRRATARKKGWPMRCLFCMLIERNVYYVK